jgi:hypothetical protein
MQLTPSSQPARGIDVDALGGGPLRADRLPIPQRRIKADVLRGLLASARGGHSIEILYQSMNAKRSEPLWRRIRSLHINRIQRKQISILFERSPDIVRHRKRHVLHEDVLITDHMAGNDTVNRNHLAAMK